jgi:sphinganine-1-phosphate aldolase
MKLPESSLSPALVLDALERLRDHDARWRDGRTFSLVYYGGDELLTLLHDAYGKFFSENALNPMAFRVCAGWRPRSCPWWRTCSGIPRRSVR